MQGEGSTTKRDGHPHQPVPVAGAEGMGVPTACVGALESMQDCLYGDMADARRKYQVCAAHVAAFSACVREEEIKEKP